MISSAALRGALLSLAFLFLAVGASAEAPQATAKPEEVGFSREGLARIDTYLKNEIAGNKIPGAMMIIQRNGRVAYATACAIPRPRLR